MLALWQGFLQIIGIVFALVLINVAECKKCMRNEDIGWRQGNIYFCDDPDLPECCEIQMEFTCCEPGPIRAMREQLQLWGTILLFCMMMGIACIYFRKDGGCCTSPTLAGSFKSLRGKLTVSKKFVTNNNTYKEFDEPKVNMLSSDTINNDRMNWQFRQKPLV